MHLQAPGEPLLEFNDFINGESLVQEDLVAWVCLGSIHMPTTEDVPVTTTPVTASTFFIRPHNYFDESPATDLTGHIFKAGSAVYTGDAPAADVNEAVVPLAERCFDGTPVPVY